MGIPSFYIFMRDAEIAEMKFSAKSLLKTCTAITAVVSSLPANAMVLEGGVRQEVTPTTYTLQAAPQKQAQAPRSAAAQITNECSLPMAAPQAHMAPQTRSTMLAGGISTGAKREARAQAMQGLWQCVTQVVGSNTPGVAVGTVVRCQVQYNRDAQGNLLESWTENGWTPSTAAVVKLDSDVITVSHLSSYPSRGGTISARSTDAIKLVAPDTIMARGTVNQFSNGQFIGQYQTASVLHRVG